MYTVQSMMQIDFSFKRTDRISQQNRATTLTDELFPSAAQVIL